MIVRQSLHKLIGALKSEQRRIERELLRAIEADPGWRDRLALLQAVPGVGLVTALTACMRKLLSPSHAVELFSLHGCRVNPEAVDHAVDGHARVLCCSMYHSIVEAETQSSLPPKRTGR